MFFLYEGTPDVHLWSMSVQRHLSGRRDPPVAYKRTLQKNMACCEFKMMDVLSSLFDWPVMMKSVSSTKRIAGCRNNCKEMSMVINVSIFSCSNASIRTMVMTNHTAGDASLP